MSDLDLSKLSPTGREMYEAIRVALAEEGRDHRLVQTPLSLSPEEVQRTLDQA